MSKPPLLTVCLLTYNQAPYVKEAIDSILMQKVDVAWELVIADDCSTDGTQKILEQYKKKHPDLIKLMLRRRNVGPEENWLGLMEYPKSKYVVYAEGDDYFIDPHKLQKQLDYLEAHPECSMCFHPVKVVYQDKSKVDGIFPTPKQRGNKNILELKDLLLNNFIQTNSAMYRWEFRNKSITKVFPRGIAPGDWYLHILHADKGKIGFIDSPMSAYRKHAGGLWADASNNPEKFWRTYGVAWVKFYREVLKTYGTNREYREILEGSIINRLNDIAKFDGLFQEAIAALPDAAEIYIDNLRQQAAGLHKHANEQAKIIEHYVEVNKHLEAHSQLLAQENRRLANRPLIKLERVAKKAVKKTINTRKRP